MTAQQELSDDLRRNLIGQYYDVPQPRRQRSAWVMNPEWYHECTLISDPPPLGVTPLICGLPVYVTEDGGFPHLIAD